jgi:drug/metabolite transporter (DMT)-like permease
MDIIQVSGTWGPGSIPGEGMIRQRVGSVGKEGNRVDRSSDQPLDLSSTLLMTLVCAIWGGAFVAIKFGLLDMPPLGSAALRFLLTTLILLIWARIQHVPLLYQWPEVRVLAVIAFLFCYFNLMVYLGTARTTSGRATIFFYTQPVFLAVLAHYFLPGDSLTLRKGCGLILAMAGLVVLFLEKLGAGHSSTVSGDLLVLSGALATATQNLIIKRAAGKIHPVALVFWGTVVSALLLGVGWWEFERNAAILFSPRAIASVLYLSLISAAFGFVAFAWLLQHNSATRVIALVFLAPVFGVLFAWLLLHETLTSLQLLGVVGVCAGVYIVSSGGASQAKAPLPEEVPAKA